MKKKSLLIIFFVSTFLLYSQQTAGDYFKNISDQYAEIEAYTATFKFTSGLKANIVQEGLLYYKSPNLLRMDYTSPENQVLSVNSRKLSIYVPAHGTLFEQTIHSEEDAEALEISGLTAQGLALFNSNYSISYVNGPQLEILDEENPVEVYKLRLVPRKFSEPFSKIILSITSDGFIRRLESTTRTGELIVLDIVDIDINANIETSYFDYEAPPTATTLTDFLYTQDQDTDPEVGDE